MNSHSSPHSFPLDKQELSPLNQPLDQQQILTQYDGKDQKDSSLSKKHFSHLKILKFPQKKTKRRQRMRLRARFQITV